jgi:hypothetical protein
MYPRPPPPPLEARPRLPLSFTVYDNTPGETERLLALAPTDDGTGLQSYVRGGICLLAAIDPATGDSPLHRAAVAGNYAFMDTMVSCFGPQLGQVPRNRRLLWCLWTHQNLAGDTALHAAARAGSLKGVKGVYRLFHLDAHDPDDDEKCHPESPAESWEREWMDCAGLPALAFVCTKNKAGCDAATEARAAGHHDVAAWLDRVVEKLDPTGKGVDEDYLREARQAALNRHRYFLEG